MLFVIELEVCDMYFNLDNIKHMYEIAYHLYDYINKKLYLHKINHILNWMKIPFFNASLILIYVY